MASASAAPSSRYLQLIEGNSEGEHRPVPSTIARDRSLESTSGNYEQRGNSDTTKVPLYERVKQFPGENLIVREGKLFLREKRNHFLQGKCSKNPYFVQEAFEANRKTRP